MRFEILSADLAPHPACFEIVKGDSDRDTQFGRVSNAESRTANFPKLLALNGRLELALEQISSQGPMDEAEQGGHVEYDEEEDEALDDESSGDDDEDDDEEEE